MSPSFSSQVSSIRPLFDYLEKQRENKKFTKSVEITATFFLITFFLIFALRPTIITISSLKGDIESKKLLKEELKNKINQVITAQDLFSQVQERYQVVEASLPDNPNFYQAADIITSAGTSSNLALEKLTFDLKPENNNALKDVKDASGVKVYSISTAIKGQFTDAVGLVSQILSNHRTDYIGEITFIEQSSTSVGSSATTSTGLSTKFSTDFYYWPPTYDKK